MFERVSKDHRNGEGADLSELSRLSDTRRYICLVEDSVRGCDFFYHKNVVYYE